MWTLMMSYTLVLLPVSMGTLRYNNHSFIQQRFMEHLLPARNEHWTKWQKLCLSLCSGSGIKTTNKRNKQNIYIWRKIKQVHLGKGPNDSSAFHLRKWLPQVGQLKGESFPKCFRGLCSTYCIPMCSLVDKHRPAWWPRDEGDVCKLWSSP